MTYLEAIKESDDLKKLLEDENCVPILIALRNQSKTYKQLREQFSLNSVQAEKSLKLLRNGLWIITTTKPVKNKILVDYQIGKRGKKLLELLMLA